MAALPHDLAHARNLLAVCTDPDDGDLYAALVTLGTSGIIDFTQPPQQDASPRPTNQPTTNEDAPTLPPPEPDPAPLRPRPVPTPVEKQAPHYPVVAFTGHRDLAGHGLIEWVENQLVAVWARLVDRYGSTTITVGMEQGADLYAAHTALDAGLRLHAYLPYPGHSNGWPSADRLRCQRLTARSHAVIECTGAYEGPEAMHTRTQRLLADSDALIAVWNGLRHTGGTADTVRAAVIGGLPIVHIDPITRTIRSRGQW